MGEDGRAIGNEVIPIERLSEYERRHGENVCELTNETPRCEEIPKL